MILSGCGDDPVDDPNQGGDDAGIGDEDPDGGNTDAGDADPDAEDGCDDICTVGASYCSEDGPQTCVTIAGCPIWSDPTPCDDGEVCTAGQCDEECGDVCTLGDRECTGDNYRICEENVDGCADWSQPTECGDGEVCSGGVCGDSCTDACDSGEARCDNDTTFQTCEEQASGCLDWSTAEACPDGSACSSGVCEGCVDGTRRCSIDGTTVEECASDDWDTVQSCPLGCDGATCAVQVSCSPGDLQCNGNIVEVCNTSGSAYLHISTCAVDCNAGLCTGECDPDAQRCNGDDVEVCNASGTAWDVEETCSNRCDNSINDCALESLDITTDTDLDGTIIVDGPLTLRSGADLYSPSGELRIIASTITIEEGASITIAATGNHPDGRGNDGTYSSYWNSYYGGTGASYGSRGSNSSSVTAPNATSRADEIHIRPGSRGGNGYNASGTNGAGGLGGGALYLIADELSHMGSMISKIRVPSTAYPSPASSPHSRSPRAPTPTPSAIITTISTSSP